MLVMVTDPREKGRWAVSGAFDRVDYDLSGASGADHRDRRSSCRQVHAFGGAGGVQTRLDGVGAHVSELERHIRGRTRGRLNSNPEVTLTNGAPPKLALRLQTFC